MTAPELSSLLHQLGAYAEIRGASHEATAWRRLASDIARLGDPEQARLTGLVRRNAVAELTNLPASLQSSSMALN